MYFSRQGMRFSLHQVYYRQTWIHWVGPKDGLVMEGHLRYGSVHSARYQGTLSQLFVLTMLQLGFYILKRSRRKLRTDNSNHTTLSSRYISVIQNSESNLLQYFMTQKLLLHFGGGGG
jgi:hypothetical protein